MHEQERVILGKFTKSYIDALLRRAGALADPGERIASISAEFLGIPYKKNSLIGDPDSPEVFVIDLGGIDCLTFLEYIEAMRRSGSFEEFKANLRDVRYASGVVSYTCRHHFFTDWIKAQADYVQDVTLSVGQAHARLARKCLNRKDSGEPHVPGIHCFDRSFHYIPGDFLAGVSMQGLRTGDYVGIYADEEGLDVTHTGIVINAEGQCLMRHASSAASRMRVVDENLMEYARSRPGIVILRAFLRQALRDANAGYSPTG